MREFRPGKSLYPLLLWAAAASMGALMLWHVGLTSPLRLGLFAALLLLGPVAAGAHAVRCRFQRVALLPAAGLVFRGGRTLAGESVRSVERRPAAFDRDRLPWLLTGHGSGSDELDGMLRHPAILFLQLAGLALWFLLLPVLALLSPWRARVTLRLKDGAPVVLEDLDDDVDFERLVKVALKGATGRTARLEQALGLPAW
jgi:hypothetical protein